VTRTTFSTLQNNFVTLDTVGLADPLTFKWTGRIPSDLKLTYRLWLVVQLKF